MCLLFGVSAVVVSVAVVAVAQLLPCSLLLLCPLLLPCCLRQCVDSASSRDRRRTRGQQPQSGGRTYGGCSPESSENTTRTFYIYGRLDGRPLSAEPLCVWLRFGEPLFAELWSHEPHPMFPSILLKPISLLPLAY